MSHNPIRAANLPAPVGPYSPGMGFERLVTIDILLYGFSLGLEFVALIFLRIREPDLPRPFRVPGGMFGVVAIGIVPMLLIGFSAIQSEYEIVWGISSFALGMILIAAGIAAYFVNRAIHGDTEPNT